MNDYIPKRSGYFGHLGVFGFEFGYDPPPSTERTKHIDAMIEYLESNAYKQYFAWYNKRTPEMEDGDAILGERARWEWEWRQWADLHERHEKLKGT